MDKKSLSERDIYTKFITPALEASGWDRNSSTAAGITDALQPSNIASLS
jgi:type I restriction enzyme R subunit